MILFWTRIIHRVRENNKFPFIPSVALVIWCTIAGTPNQACNERRDLFFPFLADAIKSGEITRGWIPSFLPESSRANHLIYNITSSRTWCAVEFSPNDSQRIQKVLSTPAPELPARLRNVDSPGTSWWPRFLFSDLDAEGIHRQGYTIYILEEPCTMSDTTLLFFAIDWIKGRGFFYRTYCQ